MNTTKLGKDAEEIVANLLKNNKHKIIALNWRTRWCEIDIVSVKEKCVYFTEVKYRSSESWGEGLDYITDKKLRQMKFAAEFWLQDNNWKGEALMQGASVNDNLDVEIIEIY
jgi:uncharacterized protein (TIGR00252 family)